MSNVAWILTVSPGISMTVSGAEEVEAQDLADGLGGGTAQGGVLQDDLGAHLVAGEVDDHVGVLAGGEDDDGRRVGPLQKAVVRADLYDLAAVGRAQRERAQVGGVHDPEAVLACRHLEVRVRLAVGQDGGALAEARYGGWA
ncbi:hypothetical protein [Streptomyces sp. NPDC001340]